MALTAGRLRRVRPAMGMRARLGRWAVAALLVVAVGYPLVSMVINAFAPDGTFDWPGIMSTFSGYGLGRAVANTFIVTIPSVVIAVALGTSIAWFNERTDGDLGRMSRLLPILPMLFPSSTVAVGWVIVGDPRSGFLLGLLRGVLGPFGVTLSQLPIGIESIPGLIFLYGVTSAPFVYIVCSAAFRQLDSSYEEAARLSGRGKLSMFFTVSLPAIRPAVAVGALISFLLGLGMYSIPAFVGVPARITVLSVYISNLINGTYPPQLQQATVLGILMVGVIGLAWLALRSSLKPNRYVAVGGRGVRSNRIEMGRWRWPVRIFMVLYVIVAAIAPLAGLLVVSFEKFWTPDLRAGGWSLSNFGSFRTLPDSVASIVHSLWLGVICATGLMIVTGVIALVGRRNSITGAVIGLTTKVPFAIPGVVFAVGVLTGFGFSPFFLAGGYVILLIAYAIHAIPLASLNAEASVRQVSDELVEALRLNGAGVTRTAVRVSLPLMLSGLTAGWAMVFAFVVGDLNAATILSGPTNPVVGFTLLQTFAGSGTYVQAAQISVIIGAASIVCAGLMLGLVRPRFKRASRRLRSVPVSHREEQS